MIVIVFINNIYNTIKIQYFLTKEYRDIVYVLKRLQNISGRCGLLKIIKQLFWIFLFSFIGEIISVLIASFMAIPGSVIGMVLLFLALQFNWVRVEQVDDVGTWLTDNMGIFFVPAGVGLMSNFGVLANTWWQLLIIMAVTTILMMGFVGKIVQSVKGIVKKNKLVEKGEGSHA